ncbi:MAG: hypothetical protein KBA51_08615 [Kiritimatiellae bacterium]|nr:hypothetical protein [Kiritimatiellia bacterium]
MSADSTSETFEDAVQACLRRDDRYAADAYGFVREALDFTLKDLGADRPGHRRHISGKELLDGFRRLALREFGPMALRVLESWGLRRTEDVGVIVFHLVDAGVLGKTPSDSAEEFENRFDFEHAFAKPFAPPAIRRRSARRSPQAPTRRNEP